MVDEASANLEKEIAGKPEMSKPESSVAKKTKIALAIDEFPEKARPILRQAYTAAQKKAGEIETDVQQGTDILIIEAQKQPEIVELVQIVENGTLTDNERDVQNRRIGQVMQELHILKSSYGKLTRGRDAPELRGIQSPFAEQSAIHFTPEEISKYGESKGIRARLTQFRARTARNYQEGKQRYQETLKAIYDHRLNLLLRGAANQYMQYSGADYTGFNQALKSTGDDTDRLYNRSLNDFLISAKGVASNFTGRFYYLTELEKWFTSNPNALQDFTSFEIPELQVQNDLVRSIQIAKENYQRESQRFVDGIQRHPKEMARSILARFAQKIRGNLAEVKHLSQAIEASGSNGPITEDVAVSQEFIDLALSLEHTVDSLYSNSATTSPLNHMLNYELGLIQSIIAGARFQNEKNEKFQSSQDLLFHVAPFVAVKDILRRGTLASRKAQVDQFGKSFFMSGGGVKVGKDYVEIVDRYGYPKRLTKQEYQEQAKQSKRPDQEAHQLCFSENSPYEAYFDGVAFVFSKALLFSQTQFASADGWHLFDKRYNRDNENSPGLEIDITREPMMLIVVDERRKDDFTKFVEEELSTQPSWAETINDPEQWIQDNVIYIQNYDANTPYETIRKIWGDVRDRLFAKHPIEMAGGRVVPTGEQGEDPIEKLIPLFTYLPSH